MSEQQHDFPKTTIGSVILAVLGGLLAPALVIFLIVKLLLGVQATHIEDPDASASEAAIAERIKPVAEVEVAEVAEGPRAERGGDEVYNAVCSACHTAGALGSPKLGDKAAWAPRIAQGYETLIKHAIEGIRMMPARGGNPDLSDTEVANAVAYMANESGAQFTPSAASAGDEAAAEEAAAPSAPTASAQPDQKEADGEKAAAAEKSAAAASAKTSAGKSGQEVVQSACMACHGAGVMGSPKIGDKAAWAPRIAQGYETLVQHAIKGIRMMPARGGNPSLSDEEVAAAVAHMANQSGANF